MPSPPRPDVHPRTPVKRDPLGADDLPIFVHRDTDPSPAPPAELDDGAQKELADVIARAITKQLGHVRISSIPPSKPEPRSSIRVAAKHAGTGLKFGVLGSGALSLLGSLIVWVMQPQYAAPLGQALKLIAGVIVDAILAAAGQAPPAAEPPPEARDVPALSAPAATAAPAAPDAAP